MQRRANRRGASPASSPSRTSGAAGPRTGAARARFIITLIRGILSLALGLALLLGGGRAQHLLGNYIGIYILSSGVLTLRAWFAEGRKGAATGQAAVLGIVTGIAVLARPLLVSAIPGDAGAKIVGMLALLTGWTSVLGGFDTPATHHRLHLVEGLVMGGFVVLLGVMIVLFPEYVGSPDRRSFVTVLLIGWAFAGSAVLFADALVRRDELHTLEQRPPLTEAATAAGSRGRPRR